MCLLFHSAQALFLWIDSHRYNKHHTANGNNKAITWLKILVITVQKMWDGRGMFIFLMQWTGTSLELFTWAIESFQVMFHNFILGWKIYIQIQNIWRPSSITILCRILVCFFFSSKWAEFLHVVSDLIESHSPVFFSAGLRFVLQLKRMQKTRRRFLQSVVERAKQKKPIVFPNNETSEASCSRLFFAYVFTRNWSANQRKKI